MNVTLRVFVKHYKWYWGTSTSWFRLCINEITSTNRQR